MTRAPETPHSKGLFTVVAASYLTAYYDGRTLAPTGRGYPKFTVSAPTISPLTVSIFRNKYGRRFLNGEEQSAPTAQTACELFDSFYTVRFGRGVVGEMRQPLLPSLPPSPTATLQKYNRQPFRQGDMLKCRSPILWRGGLVKPSPAEYRGR